MWLHLFRPFLSGSAKIMFETATISAAGGRLENEDAVGFRIAEDRGCWALADGLGGHRGGEVASRLAVDAILASFEEDSSIDEDTLRGHLERANRAVRERQAAEPELTHMRTTIVALIASPEAAVWAHAGDSRLYRFRDGRIAEQTRDHSVPQRLADAGEISLDQVRFHEDRSRLLNSLGTGDRVAPAYGTLDEPVKLYDAFLLASDGFWEYVTEPEMEEELRAAKHSESWGGKMEARLKQRASAGHDNYSAIAVRVVKQ
jgi:serine/threonine protein phosphatase PrpC